MLERVLTAALPHAQGVTPDQLTDLMEMMITDLHLRKSQGEFWMDCLPMCVQVIQLAARIAAEGRMLRTPDLPEGVVKTMEGAIELSLQKIKELRGKLVEKLVLLKQCPDEGAKIH